MEYVPDVRYLDFDYEDLVIPLYLRKRLDKWLSNHDIPNMVFSGYDIVLRSTLAHALAKKCGLNLVYLIFNKEPRTKPMVKGDRTLAGLKKLLSDRAINGQKTLFVFYRVDDFPLDRINELAEIFLNEKYHRYISYTYPKDPLHEAFRFLPKIAVEFPLNHSPVEQKAQLEHCKMLLLKYGIKRTEKEFQDAISKDGNRGFLLQALFGKEFNKSLIRDLESVEVVTSKGGKKTATRTVA